MSTTTQLVLVAVWLASGLVAALIMARRGHRHWYWTLLAVLLGPMAVPVLAERRSGETTQVEALRPGQVEPGRHLIVGIDGSPDAEHAATTAVDLLRECLGQVTLATVVDYDAAADSQDMARARARLGAVAGTLDGWDPAHAVLVGPPVDALLAFAADQHADLIAVGPTGHGLSQRLVGSVTTGLLAHSPIPVLVIEKAPLRPLSATAPLHPGHCRSARTDLRDSVRPL
jgi:nucleotide-binding universal stress UspA family protein